MECYGEIVQSLRLDWPHVAMAQLFGAQDFGVGSVILLAWPNLVATFSTSDGTGRFVPPGKSVVERLAHCKYQAVAGFTLVICDTNLKLQGGAVGIIGNGIYVYITKTCDDYLMNVTACQWYQKALAEGAWYNFWGNKNVLPRAEMLTSAALWVVLVELFCVRKKIIW